MSSYVRPSTSRIARILVTAVIALPMSTMAADWPGFRGPGANGASSESGVFSKRVGLKLAWKVATGPGYAGVAIVGDRVVTVYAKDGKDRLTCFDAATGRENWSVEIEDMYVGHDGSHDGTIATPLIDNGLVFALGARGRLLAASLADGKVQWSTDLAADHQAKAPFYGFGTSPLMVDGVLIVQVGAPGPMVAGFDPATGKKLWTAGDDAVGYQSPVSYREGDRSVVLAAGGKKLVALEPKSGEIAWTYEHSGDGARGAGSLVPVPCGPGRLFIANKDDGSSVIARQVDSKDASYSVLWEGRQIRNSYNVPVHHDGHLFAYSARFLTCVDSGSGEVKWKTRQPGDGFLSLVNGNLVIVTKEGSVHVVSARAEGYDEIAALPVFKEVVWAHPSFSDGSIYARSQGELARIDVVKGDVLAVTPGSREGTIPDSQFGRFVSSLAGEKDRSAAINRYLESHSSMPLVEGDGIVHFIYRGPEKDVAVAGDMFGARQERAMHRVPDTDLFYYSMSIEPDARLNYVFMCDYKTVPDPKNSRTTTTNLVNEEMEMSFSGAELAMSWFAMPKWTPPAPAEKVETVGKMESHELDSAALGKKHKIEVYLPAAYESGEQRFPVLYVFGGESALKQGQMKEVLDRNCGRTIEPTVAVFVNEGSFRQLEKLAAMFGEELVPFVDQTYRTMPKAEARAAVGQGFAGADAWYCALKHSKLVGKLGAQSIFLFDSFSPKVEPLFTSPGEQPLTLYLDWGKYDFRNPVEAWDMSETNRELAGALKAKGFKLEGGQVNDGTGWTSWNNRTDRMLQVLLAKVN